MSWAPSRAVGGDHVGSPASQVPLRARLVLVWHVDAARTANTGKGYRPQRSHKRHCPWAPVGFRPRARFPRPTTPVPPRRGPPCAVCPQGLGPGDAVASRSKRNAATPGDSPMSWATSRAGGGYHAGSPRRGAWGGPGGASPGHFPNAPQARPPSGSAGTAGYSGLVGRRDDSLCTALAERGHCPEAWRAAFQAAGDGTPLLTWAAYAS